MAQEGADRACDRCRDRRVKCDKRQPTCLRCEKLGKPCPGYDKKRKFVDEGITLRKKYQTPSNRNDGRELPEGITQPRNAAADTKPIQQNNFFALGKPSTQLLAGDATSTPDTTSSFRDYKLESTAESGISNLDNLRPFSNSDSTPTTGTIYEPSALEGHLALDEIWDDPSFDPEWFDLEPSVYYSSANNSCGFIPNIPKIVDEVDRNDLGQPVETQITSPVSVSGIIPQRNIWAPQSQLNTSAIITDERDHEMAYLIRHFTEAIGPWMDLFDNEKHFGNLVPLKALRDALLRNAIAAVAAKQLGRVNGNKPFVGKQFQKPATMEVIESGIKVDWYYKAANYYDKAIACSRIYLQAIFGTMESPGTPGTQSLMSKANSDDLLVAVSIFSLYESLDSLNVEWLKHLAGLKSLLDTVSGDQQIQMQVTPTMTVGRKAFFWNFARADYQAAYINRRRSLLDTEDLEIWRGCGLQVQDNGLLYSTSSEIKNDPLHCRQVADLVAHTILWLVLRVINYLAIDNDTTPAIRRERWLQLTTQLDEWLSTLPDTFQPCAKIRHLLPSHASSSTKLTETFFSINVCAAALQLYHFARILLLLNQPLQPKSPERGARGLGAFREVPSAAVKHAHQIVGIALGRPHPAVRVEMLLPLYTAGMCLEADEERRVVVELLRAIKMDTGCETDARVQELVGEWKWGQEGYAGAV